MKVTLVPLNEEDVINKLYLSCRTCYNAGTPNDMYNEIKDTPNTAENIEKRVKLLEHILNSGHHSVLEHVQLTFMISGVSRSLTHQLVRHRLCSFSQQSQRYVEFKDGKFESIMPTSIITNQECRDVFFDLMDRITEAYNFFIEHGIKAEDARSVLPNACATNIVVSMNIRELMHICNERLCSCAQAEIRKMVMEMTKETLKYLPFLKKYLVPKCEVLGYCNEDKKRSCGRKVTKDVVFGTLEVHN